MSFIVVLVACGRVVVLQSIARLPEHLQNAQTLLSLITAVYIRRDTRQYCLQLCALVAKSTPVLKKLCYNATRRCQWAPENLDLSKTTSQRINLAHDGKQLYACSRNKCQCTADFPGYEYTIAKSNDGQTINSRH